jgi:molecular chaperone HscA
MGRGLKDISHAENLPYDFIDAPGMVQLRTIAGIKSPVEVSAQILATLRQQAEDALGDDLVGAVITVPAYFDDAQRQATKDAAKLAGLNVLRLLNEPTAAAIAYGLDNASEGTYAVYDLGGGTFDISILKMSKGVFEVLSTGGDSALGGDDFDHRLFCWILQESQLAPLSDEDTSTLMIKAREAKEILSSKTSTYIDAKLNSGESVHLQISAAQFSEMTQNLVLKTITPCRKACAMLVCRRTTSTASCWSAVPRVCRMCAKRSVNFSIQRRWPISIRIKWSPSVPQYRPICWRVIALLATTGCCWT